MVKLKVCLSFIICTVICTVITLSMIPSNVTAGINDPADQIAKEATKAVGDAISAALSDVIRDVSPSKAEKPMTFYVTPSYTMMEFSVDWKNISNGDFGKTTIEIDFYQGLAGVIVGLSDRFYLSGAIGYADASLKDVEDVENGVDTGYADDLSASLDVLSGDVTLTGILTKSNFMNAWVSAGVQYYTTDIDLNNGDSENFSGQLDTYSVSVKLNGDFFITENVKLFGAAGATCAWADFDYHYVDNDDGYQEDINGSSDDSYSGSVSAKLTYSGINNFQISLGAQLDHAFVKNGEDLDMISFGPSLEYKPVDNLTLGVNYSYATMLTDLGDVDEDGDPYDVDMFSHTVGLVVRYAF